MSLSISVLLATQQLDHVLGILSRGEGWEWYLETLSTRRMCQFFQ